jgi:hypothetical protein
MGRLNYSKKNNMTYEEIARKYDITPVKAHSIVKSAYNKMVSSLMQKEEMTIFDAVLALRAYFNMSEKEAFTKLTEENQRLIKAYVETNIYQKKIEKKVSDYDANDFHELFG